LRRSEEPELLTARAGDTDTVADPRAGHSANAIRERAELLDPTPEQSEALWHEREPHMLSPDDEPLLAAAKVGH
jgi:hypothetical protein